MVCRGHIRKCDVKLHEGAPSSKSRIEVRDFSPMRKRKWCEIRQIVFVWTTQEFPFTVKTAHTLKISQPHVVTVTGKSYYDIGHAPADHPNRRHSPKDYAVWEIHPVMKLEVIQ